MYKEARKESRRWWLWGLILIVITSVIFTVLGYVGILGKTIVEREVFENSYQYTAGQEAKINMLEAQQAEISHQLLNPELNSIIRENLEAQAASIRIQLSAAKRSQ